MYSIRGQENIKSMSLVLAEYIVANFPRREWLFQQGVGGLQ